MAEPFTAFTSRAIPLPARNIDTDQIIPARFLKTTDRSGLADALFRDWRFDELGRVRPDFVLNRPEMRGRRILLAGDNFGCGSSREHAAWALTAWGIRAVVSTSFADIFRGNALKNGLLPITVDERTHSDLLARAAVEPETELTVDLSGERLIIDDVEIGFAVDPFARQMLLAGTDEIGWLMARLDLVEAWEKSHAGRVDTRTT